MGYWCAVLIGSLALVALLLLLHLISLNRAVKEIVKDLNGKLQTDTNTQISVSTADRHIRALAAQLNIQLRTLRQERLKLEHGDAELKAAITNVSHDLRTPLTAICGYLDLLEREKLPSKPQGYLAVIRERADAMCTLTEELFQYSIIAGTLDDLTMERVNVGDILEQSLAGFYAVLIERGIVPDIRMPDEKVICELNGAALRRVFDNILANAAKYSDGDLAVRLTADGTVTFVNRADHLCHVETGRLFDRFFTVQTGSGSTGLGLSIAKALTEKMGGTISAEYRSGSLFINVRFRNGIG